MLRLAAVLAALVGAATPVTAADATPPAPPTAVSPDQAAALAAVVERAIAAGLPDIAGATLHRGEITWVRKDGNSTHRMSRNGLHARLPDGRWLLSLVTVVPAEQVEVEDGELAAVVLDALLVPEQGEEEWRQGMEKHLLGQIAAADRERVRGALRVMPLFQHMSSGPQQGGALTAHLVRLGAPFAAEAAVLHALGQAWDPRQADLWAGEAPLGLMPLDRMGMWQAHHARMIEQGGMTVPDPVQALRRGLFQLLRQQALSAAPGTPDPFAKLGDLLAADETVVHAELAMLSARHALPTSVAADAPLADRLAVWTRGLAPAPGASAEGDDAFTETVIDDDGGMVTMRSSGGARDREGSLQIGEAELGALIALADDPRPCRWLDLGAARTVGDNALRAVALLLSCDPRTLIGRDPAAPWTAAERTATVAALRAWWEKNGKRPLDDILVEAVPRMSAQGVSALLQRRPADRRGPILDALAAAWKAQPPEEADDDVVAAILLAAGDHAAFGAVARAWPLGGDAAPVLTAWRVAHGETALLDRQLAAALADGEEGEMRLHQLAAVVCRSAQPAHLQRLVEAMCGPLDQHPGKAVLEATLRGWSGWGSGIDRIMDAAPAAKELEEPERRRRAAALPLALYAIALADERPAPPELIDETKQMMQWNRRDGQAKEASPAGDLRVADLAGARFAMLGWNFVAVLGHEAVRNDDGLAVDLAAPRADRDRRLQILRQLIGDALPGALQAAGLPEVVPAAPAPSGDGQALF